MAITTQNEINFSNEHIRPLAEQFYALENELEYVVNLWFGGVNANVPNSADEILEDDRHDKKIDLTGADINNIMSTIINVRDVLSSAGVKEQLSKGVIRLG